MASLRAVGAETMFRSMCFSQVHSHLPDREDVNVLDCIKFCDQFFRQNLLNCQTYALIRNRAIRCIIEKPLCPIPSRGTKKIVQKFRYEIFEILLGTIENVISQRPVKIEQRFLAHFSPRFMGFPHAFTC